MLACSVTEGVSVGLDATEEPFDRACARGFIAGSIALAARGRVHFAGSAFVGNNRWKPAAQGFRDGEAERFERACVDEHVGARKATRELCTVFGKARHDDVTCVGERDARLHPCSLRSVAKEDEHSVVSACPKFDEGIEDDFPAFFDRKAPHAHEDGRAGRRLWKTASKGEERIPRSLRARFRSEYLSLDPKWAKPNVGNAVSTKFLDLPRRSDERGITPSGDRANPRPKRGSHGGYRAGGQCLHLVREDARIRIDKVRVPLKGSDAVRLSVGRKGAKRGEVRRVDLEHVGPLSRHDAPNRSGSHDKVVARIVGGRWTTHPDHPGPTRSGVGPRGGGGQPGNLDVFGAGRDDDVLMTKLAQNVTLGRQMASNSAAPFGIELRDIEDLHRVGSSGSDRAANGNSQARGGLRSAFSSEKPESRDRSESPFAALSARHGRPLRVAILSDFTRIPYANGAAFQTRFLYQELRRCGHEVTVIGPHDPHAKPEELAPGTISLPSVPLKTYPGLHLPVPLERWVFDAQRWNFDLVFAQTTSLTMHFGVWLRKMRGIPLICVNTTHLSAAYEVLLPEALMAHGWVNSAIEFALKRPYENLFASIYNESDGLVVLSEGLRTYWRERGVTCPIHVIPRAVQPEIFDRPIGVDPYERFEAKAEGRLNGARLLCAGRHTREKSQDRVIRVFARHIAAAIPGSTLTLLGAGPDSEYYKRVARDEGVADRVIFPGEVPFTDMASYYAYADLFVHASLSETYGNVLGEALWCGTPTVAFADGMGVSSQIENDVNGILLAPGKGAREEAEADAAFGKAALDLLAKPEERARLGRAASKRAREKNSPTAVKQRIANAFIHAQEHAAAAGLKPAIEGPRVLQWMTTFEEFRSWASVHAGLYLVGHLRAAGNHADTKSELHPQIGT